MLPHQIIRLGLTFVNLLSRSHDYIVVSWELGNLMAMLCPIPRRRHYELCVGNLRRMTQHHGRHMRVGTSVRYKEQTSTLVLTSTSLRSRHQDFALCVGILMGSMTKHHRRTGRIGIRYKAQSSSLVLTTKERQEKFTLFSDHNRSSTSLVLTMSNFRG